MRAFLFCVRSLINIEKQLQPDTLGLSQNMNFSWQEVRNDSICKLRRNCPALPYAIKTN